MSRSCDGCTICCKLYRVPETGKPEAAWCGDCRPGQGCAIHAVRPASCRNFACFWLIEEGVPDDLRPDRCGLAVSFDDDADSVVVMVDPDRPDAWRTPPGSEWIGPLRNAYARVFVVCGAERFMLVGKGSPR